MGLNDTELAWAAGFFEGEGCIFGIKKRHKTKSGRVVDYTDQLGLSVGQSYDPYTLWRFVDAVGIGKVIGPYTWQVQYKAYYTGHNAYIVLGKLFPYLSKDCVKMKKFMHLLENEKIVTRTLTKALNTVRMSATNNSAEGLNKFLTIPSHIPYEQTLQTVFTPSILVSQSQPKQQE